MARVSSSRATPSGYRASSLRTASTRSEPTRRDSSSGPSSPVRVAVFGTRVMYMEFQMIDHCFASWKGSMALHSTQWAVVGAVGVMLFLATLIVGSLARLLRTKRGHDG